MEQINYYYSRNSVRFITGQVGEEDIPWRFIARIQYRNQRPYQGGSASPVTVDESLGRSLGFGSGAKSEPIRIEEQAEDNKIMTRH